MTDYEEIFSAVINPTPVNCNSSFENKGEEIDENNDVQPRPLEQHALENQKIGTGSKPTVHATEACKEDETILKKKAPILKKNGPINGINDAVKQNSMKENKFQLKKQDKTNFKPKCSKNISALHKERKISSKNSQQKKKEAYVLNKETAKDRMMEWLNFYSSEDFGLWIECCKCEKWRKVYGYKETHEVPKLWSCTMNSDTTKCSCDVPQDDMENVSFAPVQLIPGSIVWAKLSGYPWWPAMVEDDPNTEEYYWMADDNIVTDYHVTFLDDHVSRAWVPYSSIRPFTPSLRYTSVLRKYSQLLKKAEQKAKEALEMTIEERLKTFSFAYTFKGKFGSPLRLEEESEDVLNETITLLKELDDLDSLDSSDSVVCLDEKSYCVSPESKPIEGSNNVLVELKEKKKELNLNKEKKNNAFQAPIKSAEKSNSTVASSKTVKDDMIVTNKVIKKAEDQNKIKSKIKSVIPKQKSQGLGKGVKNKKSDDSHANVKKKIKHDDTSSQQTEKPAISNSSKIPEPKKKIKDIFPTQQCSIKSVTPEQLSENNQEKSGIIANESTGCNDTLILKEQNASNEVNKKCENNDGDFSEIHQISPTILEDTSLSDISIDYEPDIDTNFNYSDNVNSDNDKKGSKRNIMEEFRQDMEKFVKDVHNHMKTLPGSPDELKIKTAKTIHELLIPADKSKELEKNLGNSQEISNDIKTSDEKVEKNITKKDSQSNGEVENGKNVLQDKIFMSNGKRQKESGVSQSKKVLYCKVSPIKSNDSTMGNISMKKKLGLNSKVHEKKLINTPFNLPLKDKSMNDKPFNKEEKTGLKGGTETHTKRKKTKENNKPNGKKKVKHENQAPEEQCDSEKESKLNVSSKTKANKNAFKPPIVKKSSQGKNFQPPTIKSLEVNNFDSIKMRESDDIKQSTKESTGIVEFKSTKKEHPVISSESDKSVEKIEETENTDHFDFLAKEIEGKTISASKTVEKINLSKDVSDNDKLSQNVEDSDNTFIITKDIENDTPDSQDSNPFDVEE